MIQLSCRCEDFIVQIWNVTDSFSQIMSFIYLLFLLIIIKSCSGLPSYCLAFILLLWCWYAVRRILFRYILILRFIRTYGSIHRFSYILRKSDRLYIILLPVKVVLWLAIKILFPAKVVLFMDLITRNTRDYEKWYPSHEPHLYEAFCT